MLTQDDKLPNFLRKGQVGGWKEYFTPELNARFESEVLSKLEGSELQFAFGHWLQIQATSSLAPRHLNSLTAILYAAIAQGRRLMLKTERMNVQ